MFRLLQSTEPCAGRSDADAHRLAANTRRHPHGVPFRKSSFDCGAFPNDHVGIGANSDAVPNAQSLRYAESNGNAQSIAHREANAGCNAKADPAG